MCKYYKKKEFNAKCYLENCSLKCNVQEKFPTALYYKLRITEWSSASSASASATTVTS